jgi:hypothetical protein
VNRKPLLLAFGMSYYMMDADQRFCRDGKCHDPVKPVPGIPQCVANPLDRERRFVQAGHQRPVTNARDPRGLDPNRVETNLKYPSNAAPRKLWSEPKWANVAVPAALVLLIAPNGLADALVHWFMGLDHTDQRPVGAAFGSAGVRVLLFALAWHALRVKYPQFY